MGTDIFQVMQERHSVRAYSERVIDEDIRTQINWMITECNEESGLHIQACFDEPEAFSSLKAHYGKFSNVRNYIAMVGKDDETLDEKCGYYGEKLVLQIQQLGLNTCWVYMSYNKNAAGCEIGPGEKLCIVIAIGYGTEQGVPHRNQNVLKIADIREGQPEWFRRGVEAAMLAPTAMNQQKFYITLEDGKPEIRASGKGICTKIDLGIVKYHFELGSGKTLEHNNISAADLRMLMKMQQTEADAVLIYQEVAKHVRSDKLIRMFLDMAADEGRHAAVLHEITDAQLLPKAAVAKTVVTTGRIIGWRRLLKLIARTEYEAVGKYESLVPAFPQLKELSEDEAKHARMLEKIAEIIG